MGLQLTPQSGSCARSVPGDAGEGSRASGASPLLSGGQQSASVSMGAPETSLVEPSVPCVCRISEMGSVSGAPDNPISEWDPQTKRSATQRGRLLEGCGAAKCTRELCTLKYFILNSLGNFLEVSFESLSVAVSAPLLLQRCQTSTGVTPRACSVFKGLIPGPRAEHTLPEAVSVGILTCDSV